MKTKKITISLRDNDHFKRLTDPHYPSIYHSEALLPFSEAVKLDVGNANVRPPSDKRKPMEDMMETIESAPKMFHLKNRGITYLCDQFEFDNKEKIVTVHIPTNEATHGNDDEVRKFGIADGGHTYRTIEKTIAKSAELSALEDWTEPFVKVHFLSGEGIRYEGNLVEEIVESLNTSTQVSLYTLDEYQGAFQEIKDALTAVGFDPNLIAFRENEDKDWHILEIIQRMACFLKERWHEIQPKSMYRSKMKALEIYASKDGKAEFQRLYNVILDVITLPEYIQSKLSELIDGRRFMKLKSVKKVKPFARAGTNFRSQYRFDIAALLPMASAFRECLILKGDRYEWLVKPQDIFEKVADNLCSVLQTRSAKVKGHTQLGVDVEYWSNCSQIVLRAQMDEIQRRLTNG